MVTKELIFELMTGPSAETYNALMRAVVAEPDFNLRAEELDVLWRQFEAGDLAGVQRDLRGAIRLWIHNPEMHVLASAVARRLGDQVTAEMEAHFARCCYLGMLATGDGSLERPYQVARVADEYALLRHLKKSWDRQTMLQRDGRVVDAFECSDGGSLHFQLPKADLLTGRALA